MKFYMLFFVIFASIAVLHSSVHGKGWAYQYGRDHRMAACSTVNTSDGELITAGVDNGNCFVIKFDINQKVIWQKSYGGPGYEKGYAISETSDKGFIVAGFARLHGVNNSDYFIMKLDAKGAIDWQNTYGGLREDIAYSIQETSDGHFIVAGLTFSYGQGSSDFWVLKLDRKGGIVWQKTYGGPFDDEAYSIREISDGSYVVCGSTFSFGHGGGNSDCWILKLDQQGEIIWQKTYGSTGDDEAYSIHETTDGGFIVAGRASPFGYKYHDFLVLKLDTEGHIVWQKTYGTFGNDEAYSIQPITNGGYILAGRTNAFGRGDYDLWIFKLDDSGDILWQQSFGGEGDDTAESIVETRDRDFLVTGQTRFQNNDNHFMWHIKLSSAGNVSDCIRPAKTEAIADSTRIGFRLTTIRPEKTFAKITRSRFLFQDEDHLSEIMCFSQDKTKTDPVRSSFEELNKETILKENFSLPEQYKTQFVDLVPLQLLLTWDVKGAVREFEGDYCPKGRSGDCVNYKNFSLSETCYGNLILFYHPETGCITGYDIENHPQNQKKDLTWVDAQYCFLAEARDAGVTLVDWDDRDPQFLSPYTWYETIKASSPSQFRLENESGSANSYFHVSNNGQNYSVLISAPDCIPNWDSIIPSKFNRPVDGGPGTGIHPASLGFFENQSLSGEIQKSYEGYSYDISLKEILDGVEKGRLQKNFEFEEPLTTGRKIKLSSTILFGDNAIQSIIDRKKASAGLAHSNKDDNRHQSTRHVETQHFTKKNIPLDPEKPEATRPLLTMDPFSKGYQKNTLVVTVRGGNVFFTNEKGMIAGRADGWRGSGNGTNLPTGVYFVEKGTGGRPAQFAVQLPDLVPYPLGKAGALSKHAGHQPQFYDVFWGFDISTAYKTLANSEHVLVNVLQTDKAIARLSVLEKLKKVKDMVKKVAPDVAYEFLRQLSTFKGASDFIIQEAGDVVLRRAADYWENAQMIQDVANAFAIVKNAETRFELEYAARMITGDTIAVGASKIASKVVDSAIMAGLKKSGYCCHTNEIGDTKQKPKVKDKEIDTWQKATEEKDGPDATIPVKNEVLPEGTHKVISAEELNLDTTRSIRHAEALGEAMETYYDWKPGKGYEAHHIVAWDDPRAAPARSILVEAGIDIDSAENGIWLPNRPKSLKTPSQSINEAFTDHASLHTNDYFEYVNHQLVSGGPENASTVLNDLFVKIRLGFPR